jgi:ABC-type amino acid transport substrate-binding protein
MKFYLTTSIILLVLAITSSVYAAEPVYDRIMARQSVHCGYAEAPPFLTVDPNTRKPSGLTYDLWNLIGKKLSLKIEWTTLISWGEVTQIVNSDKA